MGKARRQRQNERRQHQQETPQNSHSNRYEFGWKTVTIGRNSASDNEDPNNGGGDDKNQNYNHYDDPRLQELASSELEATAREAPGIFFGLEVLDGDSYRVKEDPVTNQKIMVPNEDGPREVQEASKKKGNATATKAESKQQEATSKVKKGAGSRIENDKPNKKRKRTAKDESQTIGDDKERDATSCDNGDKTQSDGDVAKDKAAPKERAMTKCQKNNLRKKKRKLKAKAAAKEKRKPSDELKSVVSNDEGEDDENDDTATESAALNDTITESALSDTVPERAPLNEQEISSIQTSWSSQTGGVSLHPKLCESLLKQDFWSPTPIQASALPAAILGRRNIVGAAPTGSGKTLAFLLPIGQYLLETMQNRAEGIEENDRRLQTLILTPTRELALQIQAESDKLLGKRMTGSLVGGLAHAKQIRVLEKKRPPILVATPGRLWELMSSREHEHLNDLSQIRFLVIDEADRMIQQGSFPQLVSILDSVQRANPMEDDDSDEEDFDDEDDGGIDSERLLGLPGVRGEAKTVMLNDDILAEIARQRGEITEEDIVQPQVREMDDDEYETEQANNENLEEDDDSQISLPPPPPVYRQTFVYSATLTLPASSNFSKRSTAGTKKPRYDADVDGAIAEILEKSRAKGKTKIVDLSNMSHKKELKTNRQATKDQESSSEEKFRLPEGLSLQQIKCTQRHKDSHLYAYLMTTAEGSSGPCLVFCNSIAGVRRVGTTLQALGLDVRILHAQMQQRARFKAVELLQESKRRTVVIATDVAARGLDIPSVASVVHYDTARTVDSFVHRSGRTARGVGEKAIGCSVSLVASNEDKMHLGIIKSLQARFETVALDGRLLHEAQERVNLATKVAEVQNLERKSQRKNQWIMEKAEDAGFEVDEDLLEEGLSQGDGRDRAKLMEAHRARDRLAELLAQPMRTQRFGKFLSTNSAYKQDIAFQTQSNVQASGSLKKRRRKR